MKNATHTDLLVFGYGLPLLIVSFLAYQAIPLKPSFWISGFIILGFFYLLTRVQRLEARLIYHLIFFSLFALSLFFHLFQLEQKTSFLWMDAWPLAVLAACGTFFLAVCLKPKMLWPIFKAWMTVADLLGQVISGLTLCCVFYLVFAPVGIFLRVMRKDLLDQKIDHKARSYWKKTNEQGHKDRYFKQF